MTYKLLITPQAKTTISQNESYIRYTLQNELTANQYINEVLHVFEMIEENPYLYQIDDRDPFLAYFKLRTAPLLTLKYNIIYSINGNNIEIHGSYHQSRDYSKIIKNTK